eukprot:TRINITY_DN6607_c0_g2_i1.p1 TRINITY_DN6607_c0_g2~~TRINITY_DN6607_c0_g2_i1.p1  ORF type:complete len:1216 (+),score=167.74 TRINITY_DN6607_c0_g2_i1:255-3902(+)
MVILALGTFLSGLALFVLNVTFLCLAATGVFDVSVSFQWLICVETGAAACVAVGVAFSAVEVRKDPDQNDNLDSAADLFACTHVSPIRIVESPVGEDEERPPDLDMDSEKMASQSEAPEFPVELMLPLSIPCTPQTESDGISDEASAKRIVDSRSIEKRSPVLEVPEGGPDSDMFRASRVTATNPLAGRSPQAPSRKWVRRATMSFDATLETSQTPTSSRSETFTSRVDKSSIAKAEQSHYRAKRLQSFAAVLKVAAEENAMAANLCTTTDEWELTPPIQEEDLESIFGSELEVHPVEFDPYKLCFNDPADEVTFREQYTRFRILNSESLMLVTVVIVVLGVISYFASGVPEATAVFCTLPPLVVGVVVLRGHDTPTFAHILQLVVIVVSLASKVCLEIEHHDHISYRTAGPVVHMSFSAIIVSLILKPLFWWGVLDMGLILSGTAVICGFMQHHIDEFTWEETLGTMLLTTITCLLCLAILYKIEYSQRFTYSSCLLLSHVVSRCKEERKRTQRLIQNCLPKRVTDTLLLSKNEWVGVCAQVHKGLVIVTDLVNFTTICSEMSAGRVINILNRIYSNCDFYAERYGVEKVKTLGDAWIAALHPVTAGSREQYTAIAMVALSICKCVPMIQENFSMRVGIGEGKMLAMVAGKVRAQYEVIGDALVEATLMESTGLPSCVQVSESVASQLESSFSLERHEPIGNGSGIFLAHPLVKPLPVRTPSVISAVTSSSLHSASKPSWSSRLLSSVLGSNFSLPASSVPAQDLHLGGALNHLSRSTFRNLDGSLRDKLYEHEPLSLQQSGVSFSCEVTERRYRDTMEVQFGTFAAYCSLVAGGIAVTAGCVAMRIEHEGLWIVWVMVGCVAMLAIPWALKASLRHTLLFYAWVLSIYSGVSCGLYKYIVVDETAGNIGIAAQVALLLGLHPTLCVTVKVAGISATVVAHALVFYIEQDRTNIVMPAIAFLLLEGSGVLASLANERSSRSAWLEEQRILIERDAIDKSVNTAERMLLNSIPPEVLQQLGRGEKSVVHNVDSATVGFIQFQDVVSVTNDSQASPSDLVDRLNSLLRVVDDLLMKTPDVVKLKNIPYVVVSGCTSPTAVNHAQQVTEFCISALQVASSFPYGKVPTRAGVHTGKLSAGLLGTSNFAYDIFGDSVNIAARFSTSAPIGTIQVSHETRYRLPSLPFVSRGKTMLKGKGLVQSFLYIPEGEEGVVDDE